ncbi:AraC family transcriptional regulator [Paenibacillus amylolyticus]|nr:AraC family transcriptional regulator [Paenibacillus amylolyticus]
MGYGWRKRLNTCDETDLPVQEIGYRVGFGSDNYFIKIFKRWTGCTPSQYRHRS